MLYRENGQFKTSYRADQQLFPILQDRIARLTPYRGDRDLAKATRPSYLPARRKRADTLTR